MTNQTSQPPRFFLYSMLKGGVEIDTKEDAEGAVTTTVSDKTGALEMEKWSSTEEARSGHTCFVDLYRAMDAIPGKGR